jgi:murein DD-endopeptidase MepM/ murein hydrolase activator NlpD
MADAPLDVSGIPAFDAARQPKSQRGDAVMRFGNPVKGRIGPNGHRDPVSRFMVTQPFKPGPVPERPEHDGLDIDKSGEIGDPIVAIADGKVTFAQLRGTRANVVRIDHGQGWSSGYGHLLEILVHVGQPVSRGDTIGTLGNTGTTSTGPHVHFDISRFNADLRRDERLDAWPLLDQNRTDEEEDWMPLPLRERYERWTVPAGTPFFTEGPGIGPEKRFTTEEQLQTVAESADGEWRLLRFQNSATAPRELLYVRRKAIKPKVLGGDKAYDAGVVAAIQAP